MKPTFAIGALCSKPLTGSPVVDARDLTRRFGKGETAVDALRGVSLAATEGTLVAVSGRDPIAGSTRLGGESGF